MCGRYTLAKGEKLLEIIPNVTIREDLRRLSRYNIAPTQPILVVANLPREKELVNPGDHYHADLMLWGLVPGWAKDTKIAYKMINARAETLTEKNSFKTPLERRRCIIPADGFYEWRLNPDGSKTPMYIRMKDRRPFAFAGLWEHWQDDAGNELFTATIITTIPNTLMAQIHNRMPVILPRESIYDWLDPQPRKPRELLAWLKPYPAEEMEAYPVSATVNSPRLDSVSLIAPSCTQPSLF